MGGFLPNVSKFTIVVAYDVIGFGFGEYSDLIDSGMRFHIAYTIEENEFRGHTSLQLFVKDIKFDWLNYFCTNEIICRKSSKDLQEEKSS